MDMPARALGQPVADGLGLVRGVVVHDEMDVEVFGDRRFDLVQEATELLRAVAAIAFADDASGGDVQRCEQAGHAVALVIMSAALRLSWSHRQHRLAAVERLDRMGRASDRGGVSQYV